MAVQQITNKRIIKYDTENPNFNLTLSKDHIKTWMVSNSEKYFTRGEDIYKKNNETPFDIEKHKELEQRQKNIQAAIIKAATLALEKAKGRQGMRIPKGRQFRRKPKRATGGMAETYRG